MRVASIYRRRFPRQEHETRNKIWKVLCQDFFQKYIPKKHTVMDIGAGYCEFLRAIKCNRKIAVDKNPDIRNFVTPDIEVVNTDAFKIPQKYVGKVDTIFMSHFLEHLNSKEEVIRILEIAYKLLKSRGQILILQPNIDLTGEKYWSFIDHKIPLNGGSVIEALNLAGFKLLVFIKRFLPYTTKSRFPKIPFLIWLYLQIPPLVRPFAGQSFFLAVKE